MHRQHRILSAPSYSFRDGSRSLVRWLILSRDEQYPDPLWKIALESVPLEWEIYYFFLPFSPMIASSNCPNLSFRIKMAKDGSQRNLNRGFFGQTSSTLTQSEAGNKKIIKCLEFRLFNAISCSSRFLLDSFLWGNRAATLQLHPDVVI